MESIEELKLKQLKELRIKLLAFKDELNAISFKGSNSTRIGLGEVGTLIINAIICIEDKIKVLLWEIEKQKKE